MRNMLRVNIMNAKCSLLVPCENLVTYNAIVNIFSRNVVVLHSMKSVRAISSKVCGGKCPQRLPISAALPPSFSTTAQPTDAVNTTALPANRIAKHSRLSASIGGCIFSFWKFQKQLMQVVDFHDICRYFHTRSEARNARVEDDLVVDKRCGTPLAVV